ncbi:MAG: hypothetical protein ACN2B6_09820 [Rickettsiales bacterium]
MKYIIAFGFLLLSACATPEQIAARQEAQRQADYETCKSYGFRVKSDAFRNCLLQLDIARQQRSSNYYYGGSYRHRHGTGIGYYLNH